MLKIQASNICIIIVTFLLMSAQFYKQQNNNPVTAKYKKATKGMEDIINKENIKYAKRSGIIKRIKN